MKTAVEDYHQTCSHKLYLLTCSQFDDLWAAAEGRCQMCRARGEETNSGMLVVDHDGALGYYAVRGLLCNRCNTNLGRTAGGLREDQAAYLSDPWHVGRLFPPQPSQAKAEHLRVLRDLAEKKRSIETELEAVRAELPDAVRAATQEGMRQVDIVKATGYTREMIRRMQQDKP